MAERKPEINVDNSKIRIGGNNNKTTISSSFEGISRPAENLVHGTVAQRNPEIHVEHSENVQIGDNVAEKNPRINVDHSEMSVGGSYNETKISSTFGGVGTSENSEHGRKSGPSTVATLL
ncbi:uncharacterized protein LOC141910166 [Tubulanus polymorphus]|uniref:uncharacterized protein LOC141910166 n=1 Tax=Tubulanus polymorphus TaxID=672921 RepID=UPI003DA2C824